MYKQYKYNDSGAQICQLWTCAIIDDWDRICFVFVFVSFFVHTFISK